MRKLPHRLVKLCKRYRKAGFSHRNIAEKLKIGLGSAFNYTKDISLTREQHLTLKCKNLPKFTIEQRRIGGLHSPCKFSPRYSRKSLIDFIKRFAEIKGRIPTKREVTSHKPYIRLFGSWNNAIIAAGFSPNPVLFAKKYIANDGHKCDSLSEKIIDDWFSSRKIYHEKNVKYPCSRFTADFKIKDYFIEFFGLKGELKCYDNLMKKKLALIQLNKIKLISIFPSDIFPNSKLNAILHRFT